jgi:hypothetical protein
MNALAVSSGPYKAAYQQKINQYFNRSFPQSFPSGLKNGLQNTIGKLPLPVAEVVLAGSLINGLIFSLQEIMMQLIPKAGSGVVMRGTWLIAADETIQEFIQYALYSFFPPLFGASMAKIIAKQFNIPHFELLGARLSGLQSNAGKTVSVGTMRPSQVPLNNKLLAKLPVAKLLLFLMTTGAFMACEVMIPSLKNLLMKHIFNTSDFYTVSGLQKIDDEYDAAPGSEALKQAKSNIKYALIYLLASVPAFLGLGALLGRQKNFGNSKTLNRLAHTLQLGERFDLSKILLACGVLTAGLYGYPSVARNPAERSEVTNRILFFAVPTTLFFKQIIGNILTWFASLAMGLGKYQAISPVSKYFKDIKVGARDIFDLDLVDIGKDQNKQFVGGLMNRLSKLRETNPAKFERAIKTMYFTNHVAPFGIALMTGVAVNFINYLNTIQSHKREHLLLQEQKHTQNNVVLPA